MDKRYETRIGKWGTYFHDTKHNMDMTLEAVLDRLHEIDALKVRLLASNTVGVKKPKGGW